jgi:hypothetical protein
MGFALVAVLLALPAAAQDNGRYQLERGEEGFVRLDTVTGDMTLCRETGEGLSCDVTRDDTSDLRRDRDRLRDENRDLRHENERLRAELERYEDFSAEEDLPSEEEMEHIANWFERMMTIMMRTMRNVEDEMDCENDPDCRDRDGEGR